jgi:hypothetical protein
VKPEAYHGGDFNGVSCRNLVRNIQDIIKEVEVVVLREKANDVPVEEAKKKLDDFLQLCGMIDSVFASLSIIDPTEVEISDAERKVITLMKLWRAQGHSMTLKAHILEHHMIQKMRYLMGLGDKDESYVELLHQICGTNETRLRCVVNFNQKHDSIIRSVKLGQHPEVVKRKEQVRVNNMRKFKDVEKTTGRRTSQEDKNKAVAKTKKWAAG